MNFSSLFLFFFGAIGVFNSFLISLYFIFYKKSRQLTHIFFGFFLLFLSERAFRSLIYFFSDITPNVYSKFGPITFLFIGPFLFLYIKSVVKSAGRTVALWKYHILFWIIAAVILHLIYPFRTDPIFYKKYILKAINIQWLVYIIISGGILFKHLKSSNTNKERYDSKNSWMCLLILATLLLWLIFFFVSFTYFVVGSIVFSAVFYAFYIFFLFKKKERIKVFGDEKKYSNKKINSNEAEQLVTKLNLVMTEQKLYRNPNLKSAEIAAHLNISTHQFSQLLNDNMGKSFFAFINAYRIEEAKQLIRSNTKYTLDAIGNESGFNSKSTFYTTFKRLTGKTPSQYRDQFLSS